MRFSNPLFTVLFFTVLFLVGFLLYYLYGSGVYAGKRDYEDILEEGKLRVVTEYNSLGYYVQDDSMAGFNYEMLKLMEESFPFEIEITAESNINKSIKELKVGKYDLVAYYIPITSELRDEIAFTDFQSKNKQVLVQRKLNDTTSVKPIRSMLDLAGKTIHVSRNSPTVLRLKNLSEEIGDTIHYIENNYYGAEQLIIEVAGGEIDYAICNEQLAVKLTESFPELDFSMFIGFTQIEGWGARKNSPVLIDSINSWYNRVKDTDRFKAIYSKYYAN